LSLHSICKSGLMHIETVPISISLWRRLASLSLTN